MAYDQQSYAGSGVSTAYFGGMMHQQPGYANMSEHGAINGGSVPL